MPLPKPKDDESKKDFMDRCMSDSVMTTEYPDNDQRLAICEKQWGDSHSAGSPQSDNTQGGGDLRSAIKSHKTTTSDAAWDGPANESRLKLDQDAAFYSRAFAWRDPEGDETKRSSYKFIHHEVDVNGNLGAANIKACQTGIRMLRGTAIPDADRKGVWDHLSSHLKDAEVEPPELKAISDDQIQNANLPNPAYEPRICEETELRVLREGDKPKIVGYAAVFNKKSENLGFFIEKIAPGAFKNSIKRSDARALFNHDPNIILGRQSNGTLKLKEDERGLFMEVIPPDTQYIRDVVLSPIERGDITQQSFGFTVKVDHWAVDQEKKTTLRTIVEVDQLFDVSPVTFPAYPDTTVALRSMSQWQQKTKDITSNPEATPEGWENITSTDVDALLDEWPSIRAKAIRPGVTFIEALWRRSILFRDKCDYAEDVY